jgi:hypothetical protein
MGSNGLPQVKRVTGNIYGHPKAPFIYGTLFHEHLLAFDNSTDSVNSTTHRGRADVCTYHFTRPNTDGTSGTTRVDLLVYVDDCAWKFAKAKYDGGLASAFQADICAHINTKFKFGPDSKGIRRGSPIESFLGIEFLRDDANRTITLRLLGKIDELLAKTNMTDCNAKTTPAEPGFIATLDDSPVEGPDGDEHRAQMANVPYRATVMSILWISRTGHPECMQAVGQLARVMHKPGLAHWRQAKWLLAYLKGTREDGLVYRHDPTITRASWTLQCYVDANFLPDYGGKYISLKSTTGWVFFLGGSPISWRSRRQELLADSTCVSEYIAAADAAKMAVHLRLLMADLGHIQHDPTIMHEDNESCIKLGKNHCEHDRTKHIDCRAHLVRQYHDLGIIDFHHCPTHLQPGDAFTKSLPAPAHRRYTDWLLRAILPPDHPRRAHAPAVVDKL